MTGANPKNDFNALRERISLSRISERLSLDREWQRLSAQKRRNRNIDIAADKLCERIDAAVLKVERLRVLPLRIEYDAELPITAHRQQVLDALSQHQVIILCGATGSGKSTQLPKLCLEAGRGLFGVIGHTQPRRIAARALANRLAQELQTSVGSAVGYQVRFTDHTSSTTRVKLMTDGILLRELEADRDLRQYDTLIIDEAHERSLNIDMLLGVLRELLNRRTDLKLIITSATIDPQKFSAFFNNAPIIEVSGRSYPVEILYRPLIADDEEGVELSLPQGVVAAAQELDHSKHGRGDVLVFLPGEKQIRECAKALKDANLRNTEILPLFARLSVAEQERIFATHHARRIILATNVAETSLTVPGIRFVIDSGLARISRYSVRGKVQRLPIEKIAKASANQRTGRCGREAPGICIRLFDENDFNTRDEFTPPEILRTNLASVILKLAMLRLPDPTQFNFVDPPEMKLVNDGYRLLHELKAVDEQRNITELGNNIAALPLDPRLARMLIAAEHHRCLKEMLVLASFLSVQDPRERPAEAQQQADQHHASYADVRSDFMTVLVLWKRFHEQAEELSGNQLRKWCREQFLSFIRVREWQEVHSQLEDAVDELDLKVTEMEAPYAELHQAILTGFLGGIGTLEENREYVGARNMRFVVAPGTPLAKKPPKWIVAANLVETTRTYARMVAAVEPQWIEAAGEHLLKRTYTEPHWEAPRGYVAAFMSATLYGLTLLSRRRVNYGSVAPAEARDIMIREALVNDESDADLKFLKHNRKLKNQLEAVEARTRRRDVIADEQTLMDFYATRLPDSVHSLVALQRWIRDPKHAAELEMVQADLLRRPLDDYTEADYPAQLECAGNKLPMHYKFEPADEDDGVTITVPLQLLSMLNVEQLYWCVPGWRLEKATELLRALPKALRKAFVPVPTFAQQAMQLNKEKFSSALSSWISQTAGVEFFVEDLFALSIPLHLQPYIRVVNLDGRQLAAGRDLKVLQRDTRQFLNKQAAVNINTKATETYRSWQFDDLPEQLTVERNAVRYTVYPALEDRNDGVVIAEYATASQAQQALHHGVLRLLMLSLPQQYKFVRQQIASNRELLLLAQGVELSAPLTDALAERIFIECFLGASDPLPRSRLGFEKLISDHRGGIDKVTSRVIALVALLLKELRKVRQLIAELQSPAFVTALGDVRIQLQNLLPADFLRSTPAAWFAHLPRYVQALARRLERLRGNAARDAELSKQIAPFVADYKKISGAHSSDEIDQLKWMIEEFRVSLFAQDLKTAIPVSAKRLNEQLAVAEKSI